MAVSVTYQQLESGADEKLPAARGHVLDYVGSNYGDQASKADATSKYMVGVLDRSTGKMKAYDAQLFNLKPWVKREAKRPAAAINGNTPLSTREKSDRLIETFGSNKQKRAMHSRLKNKISEDSIHKAATTAAENAKELPVELDVPDLASFQLLPPSNKETLIPSEIYRLEHIVSETLLEDLEEKGKALADASAEEIEKWKKEESHPHFVLEKLPLSPGKSLLSIKERAAVLAYMTVLMQLFITRKRTATGIPVLTEVPHSIKEHITETFFQETSTASGRSQRYLTKLSKSKIMIHLLLLALHVDGFETVLEPLQKDTGVTQTIMHRYVRSLGGKTKKIQDKEKDGSTPRYCSRYQMQLTAPLTIVTRNTGKPMSHKRR